MTHYSSTDGMKRKPSLAEQIKWLQETRDEHVAKMLEAGATPGDGTAMIEAILKSVLERSWDERDVWDRAIRAAIEECWRLEQKGKDDNRNSWMGNAVVAISKLYAPDPMKDSEF